MGIARPCSLPAADTTPLSLSRQQSRRESSRLGLLGKASADAGEDKAGVPAQGGNAWGLLLWRGAVEARRAQELLQHEPGTEQLGPAGGRRAGLVLKSLAWLRARRAASGTQRTLQISMSEKTARFKPPKCSVRAEQLVRASAQPQPQSSCLQLCAELCPQMGEAEQKAGAILNELVHNSSYRQALPWGCVCALPKADRNTQNAVPQTASSASSPDGDELIFCL